MGLTGWHATLPSMTLAGLLLFPLAIIGVWLLIGLLITRQAGWGALEERFPDRPETAILKLGGQSGAMGGGVNINGALTLSVCPSGLRAALPRIVAPFSRPFFAPWGEIYIERRRLFLMPVAKLTFGAPAVGTLTLAARVADRLARAAPGRWPEAGPFPRETAPAIILEAAGFWALSAGLGALVLSAGPRLITPAQTPLPLALTIGLPAAFFGLTAVIRMVARLASRGA